MVDPIARLLDDEWTPHIVKEPSVTRVRAWLRDQDTNQIKLYISTFKDTLEVQHPARLRLLYEELERRARPPRDLVKEFWAWLRSHPFFAAIIIAAVLLGGAVTFKSNLCTLAPDIPLLCSVGEQTVDELLEE